MSYHDKRGKFCPPDRANLVIKGGSRYRVVRQHRLVKSPEDRVPQAPEVAAQAPMMPTAYQAPPEPVTMNVTEAMSFAKSRAAFVRSLSDRRLVSIAEVIGRR